MHVLVLANMILPPMMSSPLINATADALRIIISLNDILTGDISVHYTGTDYLVHVLIPLVNEEELRAGNSGLKPRKLLFRICGEIFCFRETLLRPQEQQVLFRSRSVCCAAAGTKLSMSAF
jgi:hypothetical protein